MSPWQNNEVFISLTEPVQHLIYALESHLFSAFTNNHLLHICHYFTLRVVSAFEDAAHTFLWFCLSFVPVRVVVVGFPAWMFCDPLNKEQTAVTVAMA